MHTFTITAALASGTSYPTCGTNLYGYSPVISGSSITNSGFKVYTINKVFEESLYQNDDLNLICEAITNPYGHFTSFVFGLSGYTGTQLGAFRKIIVPTGEEYTAISAPYYSSVTGVWAWDVAGGVTTGTYKIYY